MAIKDTYTELFSGGEALYFTAGNTKFVRFKKTETYRFKNGKHQQLTHEALDALDGDLNKEIKIKYPQNILAVNERGNMLRMGEKWNDDIAAAVKWLYGLNRTDYFSLENPFEDPFPKARLLDQLKAEERRRQSDA